MARALSFTVDGAWPSAQLVVASAVALVAATCAHLYTVMATSYLVQSVAKMLHLCLKRPQFRIEYWTSTGGLIHENAASIYRTFVGCYGRPSANNHHAIRERLHRQYADASAYNDHAIWRWLYHQYTGASANNGHAFWQRTDRQRADAPCVSASFVSGILKMWFLFQGAIFLLVFQTDQWWHWGEGSYAPALLGMLAAYLATVLLRALFGLGKRQGEAPENSATAERP
jgi:hypothetical protein